MLPTPSYRRQQQLPGQLLLLRLRNQGNQGAGPPLPGSTYLTPVCRILLLHVLNTLTAAAGMHRKPIQLYCKFYSGCTTLLVQHGCSAHCALRVTTPPLQGSRCSSDVVMLGEMMFGSVAMSYKGSTLKIHQIRYEDERCSNDLFLSVGTALKPDM